MNRKKNHRLKAKELLIKYLLSMSIFILVSFNCNKTEENYPLVIQKEHLERIYDFAKWNLYHLNYKISGKIATENLSIPLIYSSLVLSDYYRVDTNTVLFGFSHFLDTTELLVEERPYVHTLIIRDTILLDAKINGNASWNQEDLSYFLKKTQQEYHSLLQKEKDKIDEWLYKECSKKSIISN